MRTKEVTDMKQLGISIYPEYGFKEKDYDYMTKASELGFSRIFMCFLSVNPDHLEQAKTTYKEYIEFAHRLGFEVALDTNEIVFKELGAKVTDLSVFKEMGVDILRLDVGFGMFGDMMIVKNTSGIKVEFNASFNSGINLLSENGVPKERILACHNFYPQKHTGLSFESFANRTRELVSQNISVGAFVSSNNENTFGPWKNIENGLPTLEMHRGLPIDVQARHLVSLGNIDTIIIGNTYATDDELKSLSDINFENSSIRIEYEKELDTNEAKILFIENHFIRPDSSDYLYRSLTSKMVARGVSIEPCVSNRAFFQRGDVLIINDNLKRYAGEVQIVTDTIPNEGYQNFLGSIPKNEMMILNEIKAGSSVTFLR